MPPHLGAAEGVEFLDESLREATVVGLGEASHGVGSFHTLNSHLLAHLATRHGVRVFGLEAHFSEARALDRYVTGGSESAVEALDPISFWIWQTESLRALLEWIRAFNAERDLEDAIRLYGFDCQSTSPPAAALDAYLATVDPSLSECLGEAFGVAREGVQRRKWEANGDESVLDRAATADRLTATLAEQFDDAKTAYVEASSRREYELARRHLRVLQQATELARVAHGHGRGIEYGTRRDEYMAENVEWLLAHGREHRESDRVAVWAANGHVRKADDNDSAADGGPLGSHLADSFGGRYRAFALEYGAGTVRTIDTSDGVSFPAQQVSSPPEGTLHATLMDVCDSAGFLDGHEAGDELSAWLSDRRVRSVGPGYDEDVETGFERERRLDFRAAFDGVFFVPQVSAARLLPNPTERPTDD